MVMVVMVMVHGSWSAVLHCTRPTTCRTRVRVAGRSLEEMEAFFIAHVNGTEPAPIQQAVVGVDLEVEHVELVEPKDDL